MASKLVEYQQLQGKAQALQKKLEALTADPDMAVELEFRDKLHALLREYDKTTVDVINILIPTGKQHGNKGKERDRRPNRLKVYRNPETGQEVKTRGGANKVLREWKMQYGGKVVEGWLQSES